MVSTKPKFKLNTNEQVLLEVQPDRKIAAYWLLKKSFVWAMILIVGYIGFAHGIFAYTDKPILTTVLILILILAGCWLWINFLRQWQWYIITNQRCILYWGFLTINKKLIPHDRIVDIDMQQSLLERLLGIGSVTLNVPSISLNTKGKQQNLLILAGLPKETCEQVLALIGNRGAPEKT